MSLLPAPDPHAAVRARLAAIAAAPPPPELTLADRLADLATAARLFPAVEPATRELAALLTRQEGCRAA